MRRHEASVWRTCLALTQTRQAAEEAMQETFVAACAAAGSWRGDGSARSWLLGLARRQAARTWRRRAGEPVATLPLDNVPLAQLGALAGWGRRDDPEAWAVALEDHRRLHAALQRLSADDREVIVLRDLEELTAPEAAAIVGIGAGALKSRLHRARLRLMAELTADLDPEPRDG